MDLKHDDFRVSIFGDKEMVEGLDVFARRLRTVIFGELKVMAKAYSDDVVSSGMAEQHIKSRTGRLARMMVIRGSMRPASMWARVYPGAKDERGYRYPWALGMGSKKNQIDVKAYVRAPQGGESGGDATLAVPVGRQRRAGKRYGARQRIEFKRFTGVVKVPAHHRRVNMVPKPFMGGSALARVQAAFGPRINAAVDGAIQYVESTRSAAAGGGEG